MFHLTFIIVLIAGTASAKHVNKVKRSHEDFMEKCYRNNYPVYQCAPKDCTFPVIIALERGRRLEDHKIILLADDNLEQLCREAETLLDCITNAVNQAPAECKEDYDSHVFLSEEMRSNAVTFLRDVCDPDVIDSIRRNLDCILEHNLLYDTDRCRRPNLDKNCSYTDDDYSELMACYDEKNRRNCDVDDVVDCASKKVAAKCDEEAGELAELLGNAFYKTLEYPICPGPPVFRTLMKYFKK